MQLLRAAALSVLLVPAALAQSVLPPAGHFSSGASIGWLSASEAYDHTGGLVPFDARIAPDAGTPYASRTILLHAEYGLLEHVAVTLSLPLERVVVLDPAGGAPVERANADLGDARVSVRMGLAERLGLPAEVSLAAGIGLRLPMGYARNVVPTVGSGQVDTDVFASGGFRPRALPAFVEGTLGFRHRTNLYGLSRRAACDPGPVSEEGTRCFEGGTQIAFNDEVFGRLETGYTLIERFTVRLLGDLVWSVERPEEVAQVGGVFQPERFEQRRLARAGAGIDVRLVGEAVLGIEVYGQPYARNVPRATLVLFGLRTGI